MRNRHPTSSQSLFSLAGILLLTWLGLAGASYATTAAQSSSQAPPLDVTNVDSKTTLSPYITYLRDPSGQLTYLDVTSPEYAGRFAAIGSAIPNFGLTSDAIWVHLALANPQSEPMPFILHMDAPTTSYVDLHTGPPGLATGPDFATGARRPFSTRPFADRAFAFPLTVPPAATTDYYLRLQSDLPVNLSLALWQPAAYHAGHEQDEIWWGIVLGMLLLMSGYNLLLYIGLQDSKHVVLVAFGLLVTTSTAVAGGYASRWLPPSFAASWPWLMVVCTASVIAAFAMLALSFLELRRHLRPAYWLLLAALAVIATTVTMAMFGAYQLAYAVLIAALLPVLTTVFVATIIRIRQGSRLALFLLIGQSTAIFFGLFQSFAILGTGPKWPALPLLVPIDSLFLLVIMSLALANRVNLLRNEADRANAALTASEQRLNAYLDALPFNIEVHDAQLKPLYVNASIRDSNRDRPADWFGAEYAVWLRDVPVSVSGTDQPYPLEQLPLMRAAAR